VFGSFRPAGHCKKAIFLILPSTIVAVGSCSLSPTPRTQSMFDQNGQVIIHTTTNILAFLYRTTMSGSCPNLKKIIWNRNSCAFMQFSILEIMFVFGFARFCFNLSA
jgi:hypothetical protein